MYNRSYTVQPENLLTLHFASNSTDQNCWGIVAAHFVWADPSRKSTHWMTSICKKNIFKCLSSNQSLSLLVDSLVWSQWGKTCQRGLWERITLPPWNGQRPAKTGWVKGITRSVIFVYRRIGPDHGWPNVKRICYGIWYPVCEFL